VVGLSDLFTADLDGDSKQDLVVLGDGISVLIANGTGTFTKFASVRLNSPGGLSFGDFNGDGKKDFAFAIDVRGLAFVYLGDGTGKFDSQPGFGRFSPPIQTAAGDFNRDGKLDLAIAASDGVYVLLGNGDGTFQAQQIASSVSFPTSLTLGDFNGDGILDLAYVDGRTSLLSVALGRGDGTFQPAIESQQACCAEVLGMVDFNGDGNLDFVMLGSGAPVPISVLLGNGDGTFQPPQFYSTGLMQVNPFITVGDFNSDGNTDVFAYGEQAFLGGFLAGNGDGTFQRVSRFTVPGSLFKFVPVVGDFNSDGLLDFAVGLKDGSEVFLQAPH
jgi:hypothetical protein